MGPEASCEVHEPDWNRPAAEDLAWKPMPLRAGATRPKQGSLPPPPAREIRPPFPPQSMAREEDMLSSAGMLAVNFAMRDLAFTWSDSADLQDLWIQPIPSTRCWGPMTWADMVD